MCQLRFDYWLFLRERHCESDFLSDVAIPLSLRENMKSEKWGFIHLVTGDGKGKTTSSIGTAIRAFAAGKKVAIIFFDKGGDHYKERDFFDWLKMQSYPSGGSIDYFATGLDRIDPQNGRFRFGVTEEDKAEGGRGLFIARKSVTEGAYDLVILDEVNSSADLGIIDEMAVMELLNAKNSKTEIILTGRNAPQSFIDRADLVSEVKLHKHYFYHGVKAREGIDY